MVTPDVGGSLTISGLDAGYGAVRVLRDVSLDVRAPGEGPEIIGAVGLGGLLGWSWLVPPYQWAFGAVCVTEVKAIEFSAPAVRDR